MCESRMPTICIMFDAYKLYEYKHYEYKLYDDVLTSTRVKTNLFQYYQHPSSKVSVGYARGS